MARKVFFSFHYKPDNWRASKVRNIGVLEGNAPVADNDWEAVTKKGDQAIKDWIDKQLTGRSCTIVLVGAATAGRKWINHEIIKTWDSRKGVVGIYIHNLENSDQEQASKGANPFANITVGTNGPKMSTIVKAYDPPHTTSKAVYQYIADNIADWAEEAIKIRDDH